MPEWIWYAIPPLIVGLLVWLILRAQYGIRESGLKENLNRETEEKQKLEEQIRLHQQSLESLSTEKSKVEREYVKIETEIKGLRSQYEEFKSNSDLMDKRFQILAQKILDDKAEKFDKSHKEGIKDLLDPLREKIKNFEEKVDKMNKDTIERSSALKEQIRGLKELNEKMTSETHNLTRALKGDTKTQGSWGEIILESILEKTGLEKDREYSIQESFRQGNGRSLRPDVIIKLPDGKKIIIDSKVSLSAYERAINTPDEQEREDAVKAHLLSMRKHVKGLSEKSYHDLYQMESPDFVLMFVPIETAFALALQSDDRLYNEAFDKDIVIVTPTTLLATLKTVHSLWQNDKQRRHTMRIADEAGKMYDKFVGLVEDLQNVEKRLDQTSTALAKARGKLDTGRGNLIRRTELLRKLGAKAKKSLPPKLVEQAFEEEE